MFGLPSKKELERISNMIENLRSEFEEIAEERGLDVDESRAKLEGIFERFKTDYEYRKTFYENICDVMSGDTTVFLVDLYPSEEKE